MRSLLSIICAVSLMISTTVYAYSQESIDEYAQKSGLGLFLNGEITSNSKKHLPMMYKESVYGNYFDCIYGLQLGMFYRISFANSQVFITPHLSGYYYGHKDVYLDRDYVDPDLDPAHQANKGSQYDSDLYGSPADFHEWGLGLSALFGYTFPMTSFSSIDLFTGPESRCAISSKCEYMNALPQMFNRWLIRWKVGAGYNYRHIGFYLSGSCDLTEKSKRVNTHNFTLSLSLGYKF